PEVSGAAMNPLDPESKLVLPIGERAYDRPAPIASVYVLPSAGEIGTRPVRAEQLDPARAFLDITKNVFNAAVAEPDRLHTLFRWTSELAQSVPIFRLEYPRNFDALSDVHREVLANVSAQEPVGKL